MEPSLPLATHTLKSSKLKSKVFIIFISMVLCTALLGLLQLKFLKPRYKDFYSFEVKDWKGRTVSLERYRGKMLLKRHLSGISGNISSALKVKL
ncbi:probable glutathione peroxidase 8 isoform X2 [Pantherophis guttatus]|uniref:Probable glutathione peroxidase 8 isoform X2 n=1 Tax=Pantherophis guttatus TaxID=94885 RepID=A0A6P9DLT7_PANGU|nr:probable glutathione peroxidase 8 isoform X2 [Pantherophis guttatus]